MQTELTPAGAMMRQKDVETLWQENVRIPHSKADPFLPTFGYRNDSYMTTSIGGTVGAVPCRCGPLAGAGLRIRGYQLLII